MKTALRGTRPLGLSGEQIAESQRKILGADDARLLDWLMNFAEHKKPELGSEAEKIARFEAFLFSRIVVGGGLFLGVPKPGDYKERATSMPSSAEIGELHTHVRAIRDAAIHAGGVDGGVGQIWPILIPGSVQLSISFDGTKRERLKCSMQGIGAPTAQFMFAVATLLGRLPHGPKGLNVCHCQDCETVLFVPTKKGSVYCRPAHEKKQNARKGRRRKPGGDKRKRVRTRKKTISAKKKAPKVR